MPFHCFPQPEDSLSFKINKLQGKEKVDALNKLAETIVTTDPEKTKHYADQAFSLAEKIGYKDGISDAYHKLGIYYYYTDDYAQSEKQYLKSLELAKQSDNKKLMAQALSWLGSLYRLQSDFEKALKNYQDALKIASSINDNPRIIYCLRSFGEVYRVQQLNQKALDYYDNALKLAKAENDENQSAFILTAIGEVYRIEGLYSTAVKYLTEASVIASKLNNLALMSNNHYSIGEIYLAQSNYVKALESYEKALLIAKKLNDNIRIADCYASMGDLYRMQNERTKAQEYYARSLNLSKEINYMLNYAYCLSSLGEINKSNNNYDFALQYFNRALKVAYEINDQHRISACMYEISVLNLLKLNYKHALEFAEQSLRISIEIQDYSSITSAYVQIGEIYLEMKKYNKAIEYGEKGLAISKEYKLNNKKEDASYLLYKAYNETGQFEKALEMHVMHSVMKDSLRNQESTKKLVQQQLTMEFKEQQNQQQIEQAKRDAENESRLKRQRTLGIVGAVGFTLMFILALVIYRGQQKQKQANILLEKQKEQIVFQSKEITDSINYARQIQYAILPDKNEIYKSFPDSFVLYIPKDIVSGDFYYFLNLQNEFADTNEKQKHHHPHLILAAADCTGHGVPGAFMSMISSQKLDEAVKSVNEPKNILKKLNRNLRLALKQNIKNTGEIEAGSRDGLDIALLSVMQGKNSGLHLKYSGANRPLWIINQQLQDSKTGEIKEIKPTKAAIGGFTTEDQLFEQHEIDLSVGECAYVFTDGFADQFGGENGKKLTTRKFKELLISISHLSMRDQELELRNFIVNWRKDHPQVDDILVIGIRA
jgi:tetratricopeptide (TPR) repeat protein